MNFKNLFFIFTFLLMISAFALFSCGPFFEQYDFFSYRSPGTENKIFYSGEVGILLPSYRFPYLVAGYRMFSGFGYNNYEIKNIADAYISEKSVRAPNYRWPEEVRKIFNQKSESEEYVYQFKQAVEQSYLLNCADHAFLTALSTLENRKKKYTLQSNYFKDWVKTQDTVFKNCNSEKPYIPENPYSLKIKKENLAYHDREYQIAASHFYALNHDAAFQKFESISKTKNSPWREISAYLMVRTLERKSSLLPDEKKKEKEIIAQEITKLENKILSDKSLSNIHEIFKESVLHYEYYSDNRMEWWEKMNKKFLSRNHGKKASRYLDDITFAIRNIFYNDNENAMRYRKKFDIVDWVINFQDESKEAGVYAVNQWKLKKTVPWLVSAITKSKGNWPETKEILSSSENFSRKSPAWRTITFHRARLFAEINEIQKFKIEIKLLEKDFLIKKDRALQNIVSILKMKYARSFSEFALNLVHKPLGSYFDELAYEENRYKQDQIYMPVFSEPVGKTLTERLPTDQLIKLLSKSSIPIKYRIEIARFSFVRSVLLSNSNYIKIIAEFMEKNDTDLSKDISEIKKIKDEKKLFFHSYLIILRNPGLRPFPQIAHPRFSYEDGGSDEYKKMNNPDLKKINDYRENWWCQFKTKNDYE